MKEKIYFLLPDFLQNILITIFNILQYRVRYGGNYKNYLALFKKNRTLTLEQLLEFQKERYSNFVRYAVNNSPYYKSLFSGIKDYDNINYIRRLPLTNKEDLRSNSHNINTILSKEGVLSKTGGTTGKSLSVFAFPRLLPKPPEDRDFVEVLPFGFLYSTRNLFFLPVKNPKIFWKKV